MCPLLLGGGHPEDLVRDKLLRKLVGSAVAGAAWHPSSLLLPPLLQLALRCPLPLPPQALTGHISFQGQGSWSHRQEAGTMTIDLHRHLLSCLLLGALAAGTCVWHTAVTRRHQGWAGGSGNH